MNAARRRPRGRAHCHGRALFADHNPQLPMQLEALSTARDASVAGMGRKDEVGHATSALVLSAIARSSPKARTLLRYRHDLFHLIHPSFVPQEGISVVSYLNRRSLDIFTWQLCRQAQGVACGLRPHVFMPERRTAAAPCRAAGEGPRRTEQADEELHHFALVDFSRIFFGPRFFPRPEILQKSTRAHHHSA